MKIQHINVTSTNDLVLIQWNVFCDAKNICVQTARNTEFTQWLRSYILPPSTECSLSMCRGDWFVRVGAWLGDTNSGVIEWSGIVGPFTINTRNPLITVPPILFSSIDSQPIQKGVRIQTQCKNPYYAIIEYSREPEFMASQTKMIYAYDWGRGYVDCLGLSDKYRYYIRISSISGDPQGIALRECHMNSVHVDPGSLVHGSIRLVSQGAVLSLKTAAKPLEFTTNAELNSYRVDESLLRKVKDTKDYKFTSYSEFTRYKLALAKIKG